MLQRLFVKNIALISEADIEFDGKLNILSGETGSGKSVILDSINFVLGSKADKTMIRYGEREMSVRAEFFVEQNSEALKKLDEYDIESEGEIVITRKLTADGKGAIKINGNAVTASMLKSVTQHLVDVHGQSEHFFLLSEDNQLKVVDGLLGEEVKKIKDSLAELIAEKRSLKAKILELGGDESERERQLDLLNYQINEIDNASLKEGEFEELKARQNIIANTEKILTSLSAVCSVLNEEGGCADGISTAKHYMNGISALSDAYGQIGERLESLGVEIEDISETVSDLADELNFDGREAEEIDERLSLIKSLKKKYGADEKEILEFCEKARAKAEILSDSANAVEKFTAEIKQTDEKIYSLCKTLTAKRKESAEKFCKEVVAELKTLNIPDAKFEVEFKEYDENSANLSSSNGSDGICFNFSANKGEPLKPLSKVISGGEMSRFMLAVKTVLKDVNGISTYIFDEIDAGISGFTATTVAEKFVKISKNTQILAVSHLPQVCAASDAQFLIYKVEEGGKTLTKVERLDEESKINEIVRLTGSVQSAAARQHAIELIKQIKNKEAAN
ncbi:MAG: DNA repair protein RecN [Clostridia bacterium]|nr:DNA repair protein RecN [Clostridia bacterium]